MDPALWELFESGESEDEIAAIIRLGQAGQAPPDVRIVSQFGEVITVRLRRGSILSIRENAEVASFKAPGPPLGPEVELDGAELLEDVEDPALPSDERRPAGLDATGKGVVVGIVDWGFDFAHPEFRNPDGSSRILALWDQRGGNRLDSPQPYGYGTVHLRESINHALREDNPYAALEYHPADADMGQGSHGTLVASIAAGNGTAGGTMGVAPEADLVFVHNATWGQDSSAKLGNSVTVLEAVDFISRTAGTRPWVINLSMGRTGEQHDGTTLVEQALDALLREAPGRVVCNSTGNYFRRGLHISGRLRAAEQRTLPWEVSHVDRTPNELEVWYPGRDRMEVQIESPDDSISTRLKLGERSPISCDNEVIGRAYHRATEPNNLDNHIDIYLYPNAPTGQWKVTLFATDVVDGRYHAWIERDAACPGCQSRFDPDQVDPTCTTGTICNGQRTIAVGAYDPHRPNEPVASFSSMGPTRDGRLKPDLCAPGVRILGARSAPRDSNNRAPLLTRMSGTSFAAPHVTGCVALMMQVAPRALRIEEVHNMLLPNTRKVHFPDEIPGRTGSGYLDIEKAVEAARHVANVGPELLVTDAIQEVEMSQEGITVKVAESVSEMAAPESGEAIRAIASPEWDENDELCDNAEESSVLQSLELEENDERCDNAQELSSLQSLELEENDERCDDVEEASAIPSLGIEENDELCDGASDFEVAEAALYENLADPESRIESPGVDALNLVEMLDEAVVERSVAMGETSFLHRVLSEIGVEAGPTLSSPGRSLSVIELFDAFAYPEHRTRNEQIERYFEAIALPGASLQDDLHPGDLMIRRGEGELAHLSIIASPKLMDVSELQLSGFFPESARPGYFAPVVEMGPHPHSLSDRFTRRVTDEQSRLDHETLIIRLREDAQGSMEQQPLQHVCGFFGPNVTVSEIALRNAIQTNTVLARQHWVNNASQVIRENQVSQFGFLVSYWLSMFSTIPPPVLQILQAHAVQYSNYGQLTNAAATNAQVNAAVARVRIDLFAGTGVAGSAVALINAVEQSLRGARSSFLDDPVHGPWSAVFVVSCIRGTAIQLGLEAIIAGNHSGRDELLFSTSRHRDYVLRAYHNRFGPNRRSGTYHAFRLNERVPQVGDIIVQDRQAHSLHTVLRFEDIPAALAGGYQLHGDIVTEAQSGNDFVVTIGGNVGNSARRRRFPLDGDRHLVTVRNQLYTQEDDQGNLPNLPATSPAAGLHTNSTGRIFTVLSPVEACPVVPGQRVPGGVLV